MDHQDWQTVYQELSAVIGEAATLKVFENFRGSTVTFPMKLVKRDAIVAQVQTDHSAGVDIHQLAKKYQLAERTVRNYLKTP